MQTVSQKQKLNTKSSTEAELVGADDVVSHLMWTKHFLEAQGYECKQTILHQDNTVQCCWRRMAEKVQANGQDTLTFVIFYITDKVRNGDFKIKHCPTDDVIADFMTKPLMGVKFKKFRKWILNLK